MWRPTKDRSRTRWASVALSGVSRGDHQASPNQQPAVPSPRLPHNVATSMSNAGIAVRRNHGRTPAERSSSYLRGTLTNARPVSHRRCVSTGQPPLSLPFARLRSALSAARACWSRRSERWINRTCRPIRKIAALDGRGVTGCAGRRRRHARFRPITHETLC